MTKLKPCPFCGADAKAKAQRASEDSEVAWVECTKCEARTMMIEDAYAPNHEAAHQWNKRI